jgi:hypothetical protein
MALSQNPTKEAIAVVPGSIDADKIAARMLAQFGIKFIWDAHVAAASAYGLGNVDLADDLIDIAEAAERRSVQAGLRHE